MLGYMKYICGKVQNLVMTRILASIILTVSKYANPRDKSLPAMYFLAPSTCTLHLSHFMQNLGFI